MPWSFCRRDNGDAIGIPLPSRVPLRRGYKETCWLIVEASNDIQYVSAEQFTVLRLGGRGRLQVELVEVIKELKVIGVDDMPQTPYRKYRCRMGMPFIRVGKQINWTRPAWSGAGVCLIYDNYAYFVMA